MFTYLHICIIMLGMHVRVDNARALPSVFKGENFRHDHELITVISYIKIK